METALYFCLKHGANSSRPGFLDPKCDAAGINN